MKVFVGTTVCTKLTTFSSLDLDLSTVTESKKMEEDIILANFCMLFIAKKSFSIAKRKHYELLRQLINKNT